MNKVQVEVTSKVINTYKAGKPDENPMFLEKRVYQASKGKVYPYPLIESIENEISEVSYQVIYLENDYIKLMLMPELGGRIQYGYDKRNDYYFFYNNEVIKPALVGLCGPWISGGVEFNWPQHHRPDTFSPVQYYIEEQEDYTIVWMGALESMYSMTGITGVCLHKDSIKVEVHGKSINTTSFYQKFLWWANIAVATHDKYETFFPKDVHYVADHGKRFVSQYPLADSTYYNVNYHLLDEDQRNITNYKNIPVPMSYMALNSKYDFFGGYDYKLGIGTMHVANTHIAPGKKQWTWGNGEFGQAWDKQLTDKNGPYIELMAGVYTDNQPDFTWIAPGELKEFKQTWYPFTNIGKALNANEQVALQVDYNDDEFIIGLFAVEDIKGELLITHHDEIIYAKDIEVSIGDYYTTKFNYHTKDILGLKIKLHNSKQVLIEYKYEALEIIEFNPAIEALKPQEIKNNDELYLIALHLEQYAHATYQPDDYYLEALSRDVNDARCNIGYGSLLLRRGAYKLAITYLEQGKKALIKYNPNPKDCEVFYLLGLAYKAIDNNEKAYSNFYKSIWDFKYKASGYYELSKISYLSNKEEAKLHIMESLKYNSVSFESNALAYLLDNEYQENKFNYKLGYLKALDDNKLNEYSTFAQNEYKTLIEVVAFCDEIQAIEYLKELIKLLPERNPLSIILNNKYNKTNIDIDTSDLRLVFPNRLYEMKILQEGLAYNSYIPRYLLALLLYDKLQYQEAIMFLKDAYELEKNDAKLTRFLAIATYNIEDNISYALHLYKRAISLDKNDAKILFEYDKLCSISNVDVKQRLQLLNANLKLVNKRDDLYLEYIRLQNEIGNYNDALSLLSEHKFHPFEGGEGKIIEQYQLAKIELAIIAINDKNYKEAISLLNDCFNIPSNFAEAKIHGSQYAHINYYLGLAYELQGKDAKSYYQASYEEKVETSSKLSYKPEKLQMNYYKALSAKKLGLEYTSILNELYSYAIEKIAIEVQIDYFAISLPELLIFNMDLNTINKAHCNYLLGLATYLFDQELSLSYFKNALRYDINHQESANFIKNYF